VLQQKQDISDLIFLPGLSETILQAEGFFIIGDPQTESTAGMQGLNGLNHILKLPSNWLWVKILEPESKVLRVL
jgi:hypothetical protein